MASGDKFCGSCGSSLSMADLFCGKCGATPGKGQKPNTRNLRLKSFLGWAIGVVFLGWVVLELFYLIFQQTDLYGPIVTCIYAVVGVAGIKLGRSAGKKADAIEANYPKEQ